MIYYSRIFGFIEEPTSSDIRCEKFHMIFDIHVHVENLFWVLINRIKILSPSQVKRENIQFHCKMVE